MRHRAGQYLELQLPHRGADRRGIRRTLTIVSAARRPRRSASRCAPGSRCRASSRRSTCCRSAAPSARSTVSGAFTLPQDRSTPLLLVASGIGITPFVSQLQAERAAIAAGEAPRDVLLVDRVATGEDLPYRDVLVASGVRVLVVCPDPGTLGAVPEHWHVAQRFDAAALAAVLPEPQRRIAYVSGSPGLRRPRPLGAPRRGGAPHPDRRLRRVLSTLAP